MFKNKNILLNYDFRIFTYNNFIKFSSLKKKRNIKSHFYFTKYGIIKIFKNKIKILNLKKNRIEIYSLDENLKILTILEKKKLLYLFKKEFRSHFGTRLPLLNYLNNLFITFEYFSNILPSNLHFIVSNKFIKFHKNYINYLKKNNPYRQKYIRSLKNIGYSNNFFRPSIIYIYINLRKNNIFITILLNNFKVLKIMSSGIFRNIPKKGRKRSPSFFFTVKKCLQFLRPLYNSKRKTYFFKVFFKGFKRFRRPLMFRFLYNKKFKRKCLGLYNLDIESFNGCRNKKSKRIKVRGGRKLRRR
jgi:hypothetical protein